MPRSNQSNDCDDPLCHCLPRRTFLAAAGIGVAGLVTGMPAMAGPFDDADFEKIVPSDKKLRPEWVKSLTERGEPTIYRGKELRFIGMPVGGLFSGTVYLSGDGRLWLWQIFNKHLNGIDQRGGQYEGRHFNGQNGGAYVSPPEPFNLLGPRFTLLYKTTGKEQTVNLQADGFSDVSFQGQYPIGTIQYSDKNIPISAKLEAFSPFIPLNADDSGLPATVLHFTLKNTGALKADVALCGLLNNSVCSISNPAGMVRVNTIVQGKGMTALVCSARGSENATQKNERPEIVFEEWKNKDYVGWKAEGTAFGSGPVLKKEIPNYQGDVGGTTERVVNSHATAPGNNVGEKDGATGTLTSKPFTIERNFINMFIGGGKHPGKTCVNLRVDKKIARTLTGNNDNAMSLQTMDVTDLHGKQAVLEIVDNEKGPWGNIGVGKIVFSDAAAKAVPLNARDDFGTMALALIGERAAEFASASGAQEGLTDPVKIREKAEADSSTAISGALARKLSLAPGEEAQVSFVVTWHFPNFSVGGFKDAGHHYASKFDSAQAVAQYIADNFKRLCDTTRLWRDTWYDSSLPHWFLDRTFANTSILATTTCHRFKNGRFWAWEGVGCCEGTCTHVWHYAQAMGRLFPEVERNQREFVDFGSGFNEKSGVIGHRAENNRGPATDGQAGTILRAYREHQMSGDTAFLKRVWPKVKRAVEHLIEEDSNGDGILEGAQHNTLDAAWFGKISWISGLYHAALRAGEEMAKEMKDAEFAAKCRSIFDAGFKNLDKDTFTEKFGYYVQIPDPKHANDIGVNDGNEIDQVFGQSWAHQVGLGRVMVEPHVKSALKALWKYNFIPDIGPLRASLPAGVRGRPYAIAGDAGLLMCTWPKGGRRDDWQKHWQYGYFNECMSGFEHQVAGHMIWEGMLTEGLAIERAIHDRYHPRLRNPYNEIECSDHYSRAMASYGVFVAACGFECHGPNKLIGFAPKISPENFKAAFTSAEGWGSYSQKRDAGEMKARIDLRYGKLRLKTLAVELPEAKLAKSCSVVLNGKSVEAKSAGNGARLMVTLDADAEINAGEFIEVTIQIA